MQTSVSATPIRTVRQDPWWVRWPLTVIVVLFLAAFVVVPLVNVFANAFAEGMELVWRTLSDPLTLAALRLTLFAAVCAVALNLVFGVAAAWAIARFQFRGKAILTTLIDLPFTVSPVIAGLLFVLLFGAHGYFGPFLQERGIRIVFAWPSIVLATTFVTFPFIARELIPVMEALGSDEEQAARTLGASGWQMFWLVTLPNIKWGLLYGVLLCSARAIGEFGAVNVVSGKLQGQTDTLPIYIEKLYQGLGREATAAAFTVSALLTFIALLTLGIKSYLEWKARPKHQPQEETAP